MPEIFLLSGWGCTGNTLGGLINRLSGHFNVHSFSVHDLIAAGAASGKDNFTYESRNSGQSAYAATLAGILKRAGSSAVLIGWSAGGTVALEAAAFCENVAGIVLISSTSRFCKDAGYEYGQPESIVRAMARKLRHDPESVLMDFFKSMFIPVVPSTEILSRLINDAEAIGTDELVRGLNYLRSCDHRDTLKAIEKPVFVIHGDKDSIIPWHAGRFIADNAVNSRWSLHDSAGHDLPLSRTELIYREIVEFISGPDVQPV